MVSTTDYHRTHLWRRTEGFCLWKSSNWVNQHRPDIDQFNFGARVNYMTIISTFVDLKHQLSLSTSGPIFDAVDITSPYEKRKTWPEIWGVTPPKWRQTRLALGSSMIFHGWTGHGRDTSARQAPYGLWRLTRRRSKCGVAMLLPLAGWASWVEKWGYGRFPV